ncbi:MAG: PEP/pyruvate-binding domain-containing protein, partial [Candidatus ainarchaeum sp.]|nr:PEP/pyruvate-binding domain-containing protein [Candidatus ainarchaeum sp.]
MSNILWFNEVSMKDVDQVGGKGASLGEMVQNNFPVPNGFVVTSKAYFDFLDEAGIKQKVVLTIDNIDVENTQELETKSKEIRELILKSQMPLEIKSEIVNSYEKLNTKENNGSSTLVAVRSSATAEDLPEASFAGQQETYLNVLGNEDLLLSVRKCWASLFTARAVYYRKKQGFGTKKVGLCVVVQKMIQSDVSGIMFTADPVGDETKIVVEAGFGLGETVVSGSITPDNYIIDKDSFKIISKKINKQEFMLVKENGVNVEIKLGENKASMQKFSDEKIIELSKIGKTIEDHYAKPMDIEWGMENNILYIVQARPITTLGKKTSTKEDVKQVEKSFSGKEILLNGLPASPGIISGIAKIVPNIDDIVKVNSGDILVTKMTSPSWVPVMKKAA